MMNEQENMKKIFADYKVSMDEAKYDSVMNTNLKGPIFLSQAVAKKMIK